MISYLPEDLENIIFSFLIIPKDYKTIKCISQKYFKLMYNLKYYKEKRLLDNRTRMISEENIHSYYYNHDDALGKIWEFYHKWEWPINHNNRCMYRKNNYVDVLDKIGIWCPGKILAEKLELYDEHNIMGPVCKKFYIQFLGWSDYFNEWVTVDKLAQLGTKTINPRNKYESIGKHKIWCLYNFRQEWYMVYISLYQEQKDIKLVHLNSLMGNMINTDSITKNNIDSKIRYISNATVLLSLPSRRFQTYNRALKY